ncbi:uncharacterized protein LOC110452681 [Mizuhopecten yessoensis]|uniref:CD209 antigen-like protein C n=1 Tax=Mizuhopecten yessoensis TaxID=6573 RepID=A0A210QIW7_MIZYE|nr:uncharacterized protein LOC110452681 [Mizuhopecten yessoensis]OWF48728.1 CD209 antigen-like protein C [Mizuhopecten yessoensis]
MEMYKIVVVNLCVAYIILCPHTVSSSLHGSVVSILNIWFNDMGRKISVIDETCDVIESSLRSPECDGDREACWNVTLPESVLEIKTIMDTGLEELNKTLEMFTNELRQLRVKKDELMDRAIRTTPQPTPTTPVPEEEDSGSAMQGDAVQDEDDYTDGVAVSCPPGWITIEGFPKCYYVAKRNEKANWNTAKAACFKKGGKLVEIKTDAEAAVLKDAVIPPLSVYHYAYVGRRKLSNSNMWVFLTNEEPVNLSLRSWNKPDETTRNDCGCVSRDSEFNMVDCVCSGIKMYYICEKSG